MTETTTTEVTAEPALPIEPSPDIAAPPEDVAPPEPAENSDLPIGQVWETVRAPELDVALPEAEAPAAERALPFDVEHLGVLRRAVLDALLDADEPLTVAKILTEMPAGTSRNSAESAIKREFDSGRILRVGPGVYTLAPAQSAEPAKPDVPPPVPTDEAVWLAALEAWAADPGSWDPDRLGPPLNQAGNLIPPNTKLKFTDRLRKREARRQNREAAAAKQAAADAELRDKLLAVTGGNFMDGPGLSDLSPVKQMLADGVPVESIKIALKRTVDRRINPRAPPIGSWRNEPFLRAVARCALLEGLLPRLVEAWSTATAGTAPQKPADAPKASSATPEPAQPEHASVTPQQQPCGQHRRGGHAGLPSGSPA